MALVLKDRVRETTTTTGTGTITLAGAATGFQTFTSVLSNSDTTYYCITDGTDFEVGLGTFTTSGTTLSRDTVLESSNSGSKVDWGAGTKDVFITQPAEKAVYLDSSGNIDTANGSNLTNLNASNLGSGTVPNARLDAQLQDVAGLAVTDGGFIVGDGSNFVLETGATARTSIGVGSIATQAADSVNIDGGAIDGVTLGTNSAVTEAQIDNININGNAITSTDTNGNIDLTPNGTGDVQLNADTVRIGDSNADATITTNGTGDLTLNTNAGTNSGSIVIADAANGNITLAPNGTGDVHLDADTVRVGDNNANATITTNGTGDLTINTNGGTNSGSIVIADAANGNISITPNGTGDVVIDGLNYPQSDGSAGEFIKTDGSGQLSFAAVESFPSGTKMLFNQTSAPTGFTKDTSNNNNSALRVVTGTVGTGGSVDFTTAFATPSVSGSVGLSGNLSAGNLSVSMSGNIGNTSVSSNQIGSHSHGAGNYTARISASTQAFSGPFAQARADAAIDGNTTPVTGNSGNKGGGGSHNHSHNLSGNLSGSPGTGNLAGSLSSATATLNVKYVDVIVASKD